MAFCKDRRGGDACPELRPKWELPRGDDLLPPRELLALATAVMTWQVAEGQSLAKCFQFCILTTHVSISFLCR